MVPILNCTLAMNLIVPAGTIILRKYSSINVWLDLQLCMYVKVL